MGWTYFYKARGVKAVDAIKSECGVDWCAKHVVAESATREAVFLVVRQQEPDSKVYVPDADGYVRALAVFKIDVRPRDSYNFGYKDMTEAMGPVGCEAPMSIIEQCSPLRDPIGPEPEYSSLLSAREYRERSKRMAEHKAFKRKLKPGDKIMLARPMTFRGIAMRSFTVERCRVRGRKGLSTVFRADNGMLCNITARNMENATVEQKATT